MKISCLHYSLSKVLNNHFPIFWIRDFSCYPILELAFAPKIPYWLDNKSLNWFENKMTNLASINQDIKVYYMCVCTHILYIQIMMTNGIVLMLMKMMMLHKITLEVLLLHWFLSLSLSSIVRLISACWCRASSITSSRSFPAKWTAARWDQSPLVIPVAEQTAAGP